MNIYRESSLKPKEMKDLENARFSKFTNEETRGRSNSTVCSILALQMATRLTQTKNKGK